MTIFHTATISGDDNNEDSVSGDGIYLDAGDL